MLNNLFLFLLFIIKKKMKKERKIIIVGFLSLIICSSIVSAVSLGVSPATLEINGAPGSTVEKTLTVSTSDTETLSISVSAESELKEWISYEPKSDLTVTRLTPLKLNIKFKIPRSAEEKTYEDIITIATKNDNSADQGGSGSNIAAGVAVRTSLNVSNEFKEGGSNLLIYIIILLIITFLGFFWIMKGRKWKNA